MSSDLSTPRQGIHSHRIPILDIATVDTVGTIAGGYVIARTMNWSFPKVTAALFALGLWMHHLYGIDTTMHRTFMQLIGKEMSPDDRPCPGVCPMAYLWQ